MIDFIDSGGFISLVTKLVKILQDLVRSYKFLQGRKNLQELMQDLTRNTQDLTSLESVISSYKILCNFLERSYKILKVVRNAYLVSSCKFLQNHKFQKSMSIGPL